MLSNAYFLAKFRFDTAENEPAKILQNLPISGIPGAREDELRAREARAVHAELAAREARAVQGELEATKAENYQLRVEVHASPFFFSSRALFRHGFDFGRAASGSCQL